MRLRSAGVTPKSEGSSLVLFDGLTVIHFDHCGLSTDPTPTLRIVRDAQIHDAVDSTAGRRRDVGKNRPSRDDVF